MKKTLKFLTKLLTRLNYFSSANYSILANKSNKTTNNINTKTITIRRTDRKVKQYNIGGRVRDPTIVLVLKIGKSWGPLMYRKQSVNLITVISKELLSFLSQGYKRFKEICFYFITYLFFIVLIFSSGNCLEENLDFELYTYGYVYEPNCYLYESNCYLDSFAFDYQPESIKWWEKGFLLDWCSKINDLYLNLKISVWFKINNLYLKIQDLYFKTNNLIYPKVTELIYPYDDNYEFEMGLDIPYIADLNCLNDDYVEMPEEIKNFWEKVLEFWNEWWTKPTFPFEWSTDELLSEYKFESSELFTGKVKLNEAAYIKNNSLSYSLLDLDDNKFIITKDNILNSEWLQGIRDIALDTTVETVSGNTITTLKIDTEVANLLFSEDSMLSGTSETSEGLQYANEIRAIQDNSVVFNTPEFREMFEHINETRALTILETSPTNLSEVSPTNLSEVSPTFENTNEIEWANQMRENYRERISILFSNQNPDAQPIPSWSEVPTRPIEPWAIEQWEKDNAVRLQWAKRLNGGYNQVNIITNELRDTYYSMDWFNEGYQDLNVEDVKINSITNELRDEYYSMDWFNEGYQDLNVENVKINNTFEEAPSEVETLSDIEALPEVKESPISVKESLVNIEELNQNISRNDEALTEFMEKDLDINSPNLTNLIEERKSLLDLKSKYFDSEVQRTSRTPVNNVDLPLLHEEIEAWNIKVKKFEELVETLSNKDSDNKEEVLS